MEYRKIVTVVLPPDQEIDAVFPKEIPGAFFVTTFVHSETLNDSAAMRDVGESIADAIFRRSKRHDADERDLTIRDYMNRMALDIIRLDADSANNLITALRRLVCEEMTKHKRAA